MFSKLIRLAVLGSTLWFPLLSEAFVTSGEVMDAAKIIAQANLQLTSVSVNGTNMVITAIDNHHQIFSYIVNTKNHQWQALEPKKTIDPVSQTTAETAVHQMETILTQTQEEKLLLVTAQIHENKLVYSAVSSNGIAVTNTIHT